MEPKETFYDSVIIPVEVQEASTSLKAALAFYKEAQADPLFGDPEVAQQELVSARSHLQKVKRKQALSSEVDRDSKLHSILSNNPGSLFKSIKASTNLSFN